MCYPVDTCDERVAFAEPLALGVDKGLLAALVQTASQRKQAEPNVTTAIGAQCPRHVLPFDHRFGKATALCGGRALARADDRRREDMDVMPITKRVLHPGEVVDELRPPVDVFGERLQQVA